jgi:hypothetical protein
MKKLSPQGEQIADYVWLDQTKQSWHIWAGNPFCAGLYRVPLKQMDRKKIIKMIKEENAKEKTRFKKQFPKVKWEVMK